MLSPWRGRSQVGRAALKWREKLCQFLPGRDTAGFLACPKGRGKKTNKKTKFRELEHFDSRASISFFEESSTSTSQNLRPRRERGNILMENEEGKWTVRHFELIHKGLTIRSRGKKGERMTRSTVRIWNQQNRVVRE